MMKVKSESKAAQSCPTLSDSVDCSLPGSSIHGIFQARVLEWGAIVISDQRMRYTGIQYTFIDKMPQVLGKEILKIDSGRNSEAKTGNLGVHFQS